MPYHPHPITLPARLPTGHRARFPFRSRFLPEPRQLLAEATLHATNCNAQTNTASSQPGCICVCGAYVCVCVRTSVCVRCLPSPEM